ncbi:ankyrin repeat protein (macronuclear) [Tetrahymena thermophila SB210]|uniref:Ankyrin repeat protein n=1 Tax=Tetrahymena thermophila (strain SB210) TaxID=312017 RepID=Q23RI1_TETTS|nr:ankyrin repeat protein [Tetrahymena thermophila SB210]EAR99067.2 ankyrin repeat protein [Tetrahymena thermophila SB210]|eukprot:XP_001019312.2 ankyrin repeat protein [Tetrahymena thermophila SB210]
MSSNFQIYEKVNDYDFLPENAQKFKDPREFTNVLFKRMSYHFEDGNGKINDFIIAQSFSKNNALINQNLNLKYHSQKMNLRQSVDKKDDEFKDVIRKKSTIEAEENWLAKQQNPQDSMAQYDYTIKNDCKTSLEKLEELKTNQIKILNSGLRNKSPQIEDTLLYQKGTQYQQQENITSYQPYKIKQNTNDFQVVVRSNSKDKTGKSSLNQSYIGRKKYPIIPSFERQTETSQLKVRNNQQYEIFENIENAILSRPQSAFHNCQKLQKMYNTQNRQQLLIQQNQRNDDLKQKTKRLSQSNNASYISEKGSFLSTYNNTQETVMDYYNFTSNNIQNEKIKQRKRKQNPEEVSPYQKHKFHKVCQKIQNINSLDHYMKMTQEEIDQLGKSVVSEEQKQQNTNERMIKKLNKSNIEILKQQQHDQLLKIVDIFQDTKNSFQLNTIQKDSSVNQNKSVLVSTAQSIYQNKSHSLTPNSQNKNIRNVSSQNQAYTPSTLKRKLIANKYDENLDYSPFYVKDKVFSINSPNRRSQNQSPQSSEFSYNSQNQILDQQKGKQPNEDDEEGFSQYIQNLEGTDLFMNANSEEQLNAKLKVLHLKQSYYKMKNTKTITDQSQIYFGKKSNEQGKISLGLEQKIKLFKYLEDDDDIKIHFQKPKKYVRKQVVVSNKQKQKEISFVQAVRDQQNQLGIQSLKIKFGKQIAKLYDFLKKCIRLKVCVDDIIEQKVFTTEPYERPGSYVFFKMVKQNQLEYVKNQIKECRWKLFDFDHMLMTPLHISIIKGYKEMACYFIDQLSDLEAEDIDNKTPLWYAIKTQQYDIAKYLLINHAIPWANDNFKYYDFINDIDMRTSLKVARQIFFLMSCTAYKGRQILWEKVKNKILDPLTDEQL